MINCLNDKCLLFEKSSVCCFMVATCVQFIWPLFTATLQWQTMFFLTKSRHYFRSTAKGKVLSCYEFDLFAFNYMKSTAANFEISSVAVSRGQWPKKMAALWQEVELFSGQRSPNMLILVYRLQKTFIKTMFFLLFHFTKSIIYIKRNYYLLYNINFICILKNQ